MLAEEIMTKSPRTISRNASIAEAVDALESMHVRHLPVVDEKNVLVGIVSDRDVGPLMRTLIIDSTVERMEVPPEQRSVGEIMSPSPVALGDDADVAEIIDTLIEERVGAVPIVDDADHVIGIVSYVDVLGALRPDREAVPRRDAKRQPASSRSPQ